MTMSAQHPRNSVLTRLAALAPLTASDERHINNAVVAGTVLPPRRDLIREGERITTARLLVDGWAFRTHLVQNGYRQSDEEKLSILKETTQPGAIMAVVARRYGIGTGQFYTWRKQLLRGANRTIQLLRKSGGNIKRQTS